MYVSVFWLTSFTFVLPPADPLRDPALPMLYRLGPASEIVPIEEEDDAEAEEEEEEDEEEEEGLVGSCAGVLITVEKHSKVSIQIFSSGDKED